TEEKSFGCEVLVHSSMKIKMILRQVSETDYFELQSKRSFICHSVRRNFHGSCGDRRFPHQGNQAVQVGGFWCGELVGHVLTCHARLNRPDQTCRLPDCC